MGGLGTKYILKMIGPCGYLSHLITTSQCSRFFHGLRGVSFNFKVKQQWGMFLKPREDRGIPQFTVCGFETAEHSSSPE